MSLPRFEDSRAFLAAVPCRGAYLDVACGRREMLGAAMTMGFLPVQGTEIVPDLIDGIVVLPAWADALPFLDQQFDVVSAWDVLEHIPPDETLASLAELHRVARRHVVLSISNNSSQPTKGEELHCTRQSFDEWNAQIRTVFSGHQVLWDATERRKGGNYWRVDLC